MHVHEAVVRLQHTDAAGVLFFARIFELAHVAYEDLLESIGHPIPRDMAGAPYVIPIVHSRADLRLALRLGDRVRIETRLTRLRARSFTVAYAVRTPADRLAASVETVHVVVDPATGRARRLPEALHGALAAHLEECTGSA